MTSLDLLAGSDPVPDVGPQTRGELAAVADRLLTGARAAQVDGRFWWLDDDGRPDPGQGQHLWITTRMTHVLSLGHLLGRPGDGELADLGLASIDRDFGDDEHGGWFPERDADGEATRRKTAYEHAFVLLAGASTTMAGRAGGPDLLDRASSVVLEHFWDDDAGAMRESFEEDWSGCEEYRGANANMHTVESFLAAADATGDDAWLIRAGRIVERLIDRSARSADWRVPEHYDATWQLQPEYNRDQPRHAFRPYGVTPGHGFEWARLLVALGERTQRQSLTDSAVGLFDRAMSDGWDGSGLVYTTDWEGRPVVAERFHWVTCEAMATAYALWRATGQATYGERWSALWDHARAMFVDTTSDGRERGGWRHEVGPDGRPSDRTWSGRPDVYHALQAVLFPLLPPAASFAAALR